MALLQMISQQKPRCLLVYPEFTSQSFWNYRNTCKLVDAAYPAAPLGLITVAAMLPNDWEVKLVDCNVEPLEDRDILWADFIFSGGMISQQGSHLKLIERVKKFGKIHVVGGPDPTSSPHLYEHADYLVLGEAEISLKNFLVDWQASSPKKQYVSGKGQANVQESPVPRFDLLKLDKYLHIGIQFARGCPFNCEFCDIIELFGRVPRLKKNEQIIKEIQALYDLGYRGHIDLVDDNFIGNRPAVRKLIPEMIQWQKEHKWPFEFSTEATINLADDDKLLELMQEVGFSAIFVGIESPDEETLKQTQKGQNTNRSIPESIRKINRHGIFVNAGYIVGFDSERGSVAPGILKSIEETLIPVNMVGLLTVLPNTQLARRMLKEERLQEQFEIAPDGIGDQCLAGLNYETLRPKPAILSDYYQVLKESFSPKAYFGRVRAVSRLLDCSKKRLRLPFKYWVRDLRGFGRLVLQMGIQSNYRWQFWKTLLQILIFNPKALRYGVALMALYLHFGPFKDYLLSSLDVQLKKLGEGPEIARPIRTHANAAYPTPALQPSW